MTDTNSRKAMNQHQLGNPPDRLYPTQGDDETVSLSSSLTSAVTTGGSFSTPPSYALTGNELLSNNVGRGLSISPSTPKEWERGMKGYLSEQTSGKTSGSSVPGIPDIDSKLSLSEKIPRLNVKDSQSLPAQDQVAATSDKAVHGGNVFKNLFGKKARNKNAENDDMDQSSQRSRSYNSSIDSIANTAYRIKHAHPSEAFSMKSGSLFGTVIGPDGEIRTIKNGAYVSNVQHNANRERKLKFTEMHNSPTVKGDSASSYLGEDKSVHHGQNFVNVALPGRSSPNEYMRSQITRHLTPVTEDGSTLIRKRILKPIEGAQSWSKSTDHLLVPAVIEMSPNVAFGFVERVEKAYDNEGMSSPDDSGKSLAFGKYILGKATQVGSKSPSPSVFVLRQNYLFEFDEFDNLDSKPRGLAFLQDSLVSIVNDNTIQLMYHEKPNKSRSKMKKIVLLVEHNDAVEIERWIHRLQEAANLRIEHLYEYDPSEGGTELGKGRYATIRPARRRQSSGNRPLSWAENGNGNTNGIMKKTPSFSSFGNVTPHSLMEDEYECALKIVDKASFWERVKKGKERADAIVREISVQATLMTLEGSAQNSLRLLSFFETFDHVVLELELLDGNDLFQHISKRGTMTETEAANMMYDLLTCIASMNQAGIAHRDLKPANILMGKAGNDGKVKLGDFGMATFVGNDHLVHGRCGTPGYVAPEILLAGKNEGYRNNVDVFSAGVTLYVLLSGYEPFYGETEKELVKDNKECKVDYPESDWKTVSIEGQDLVEKMLQRDPTRRITAIAALSHPWITRRAMLPKNNKPYAYSHTACCIN